MNLKGIYAALMSPFNRDSSLNEDALRALVRRLRERNVHGLYVGGTSGELFALTVEERKKVTEIAKAEAGDHPVIVHVGAMSAADARAIAKHAGECGCAAISAIPPFYCKYTKDETTAYYKSLMDASGLKMFLYNIPAFTGVNLDVAYYRELLGAGRVAGVKHTSHNLYEMERLRAANPDGIVLSGYDEVFCGAQVMGAHGCIGTSVNAIPEHYQKITAYLKEGKVDAAYQVQKATNTLLEAFINTGSFFACVKHVLTMQGIPMGDCRPPFLPLSAEDKKKVEEAYAVCMQDVKSL